MTWTSKIAIGRVLKRKSRIRRPAHLRIGEIHGNNILLPFYHSSIKMQFKIFF
jgi:hypothetical protein